MDFYTYKASLDAKRGIDSIYDGDTISNLVIDMGFKMKYINSFRIIGIDTPELRTKSKIEKAKGYQARDMLRLIIGNNDLAIQSISAKGTGKYGRVLGHLFVKNGDIWQNAGSQLIKCGLAVEYWGGTKVKDWSKDD
jgi:micrococcal nuclease